MRYGFVVPNNFGVEDPRELVALACEAESLGFDSVWVNHHVLNVGYVAERLGDAPYHDALMTLAWIGAATERVKVGTSVLVMPYLHPMVLAKELATLDHLTRGRLVVGLGVGSNPGEHEALGLVPYASRGRYSNEFLGVLRALWSDGAASFDGEFFSFSDLQASPKPMQRPGPPILVGGNRPQALARAGRYADGWHGMSLKPDSVRKRIPELVAETAAAGREPMREFQLRMDLRAVTAESVSAYADAGITELVLSLASGDVARQQQSLRDFAREFIAS
ncbi:MAG: TIGR03619 family F420-dependent LLM class oxidoreductase [Pseudomonadota bacterium]